MPWICLDRFMRLAVWTLRRLPEPGVQTQIVACSQSVLCVRQLQILRRRYNCLPRPGAWCRDGPEVCQCLSAILVLLAACVAHVSVAEVMAKRPVKTDTHFTHFTL